MAKKKKPLKRPKKRARPSPAKQAIRPPLAGRGGNVPPVDHQFKPGESGNPKGRPPAGASVREWINQMAEWSLVAVKAVMVDPEAPMAKLAAARVWVDAASQTMSMGGIPIAGPEFDRICDRTEGKPKQSITAEVTTPSSVEILTPLTRPRTFNGTPDPANPGR